MDALSEILSSVKLNGAVYFNAEFSAPWGVAAPSSSNLAPILAPGVPHLLIYHFVLDGRAVAHVPGHEPVVLQPGDVAVIPHGNAHLFTSDSAWLNAHESSAVEHRITSNDLTPLRAGGGGATTRFVCGYMACDPQMNRPILSGLPPVFRVNIRNDPSGRWLESCILQLVEEAAAGRVGGKAMLAKLSEALFVETLRRYVLSLPDNQTGWLAGARDPIVGKSLGLLHQHLSYPWTIAELALRVGISRSALVERFTRYLDEPPMSYLTRWRLGIAARALTATPKGVAEIAGDVGYESEAAFNRAFKRAFGLPPARYRREQRVQVPIVP